MKPDTINDIESQLIKMAASAIGVKEKDIDIGELVGNYMDSLDEIEFLMAVETHYNIEITDVEAKKHATIIDAAKLVNSKVNSSSTLPSEESFPDDWFASKPLEAPTGEVFKFHQWSDLRDRQQKAIHALLGERVYQDKMWNDETTGSCGVHSPTEWLVFIQHYLNTAMTKASTQGEPLANLDVMDNIRKIGAMCMAAMEQNEIVEREHEED